MSPKENEELVNYRFRRAKEAYTEAGVQLENGFWNLAVNRLYYACFYASTALLATNGIYTKTHSGAKQMFSLHYVKTGILSEEHQNFYNKIFSLRQDGDYEDYCDYEKDDVVGLMQPAKEFISVVERILYKDGRN